jgi:hypothetical protein
VRQPPVRRRPACGRVGRPWRCAGVTRLRAHGRSAGPAHAAHRSCQACWYLSRGRRGHAAASSLAAAGARLRADRGRRACGKRGEQQTLQARAVLTQT